MNFEQIAREATEKIQELPNGLKVHPGRMSAIILVAIEKATAAEREHYANFRQRAFFDIELASYD